MAGAVPKGSEIALSVTLDDRKLKAGLKSSDRAVGTFTKNTEANVTRMAQRSKKGLDSLTKETRETAVGMKGLAAATKATEAQVTASTARMAATMKARLGSAIRQEAGRMAGGVRSAVSTVAGAGLGMAAVMGIRDAKKFKASLTDMQITAGKSAAWNAKVEQSILAVSNATGKSKEEVASYLDVIITQTGDADYAVDTLSKMGRVAVATGADMADLAGTMTKLGGAFQIAGKDADKAWNIIRLGETVGSVTVKNLSAQFGKIASLAPQFGKSGMGLQGLNAFSGLFQMGARGFGQDEVGSAATATSRFLGQLAMHGAKDPKKLAKKLGLDVAQLGVKTKTGFQWNDLPSVFKAIGMAAAKDPSNFSKYGKEIFGLQGVKVAQQLQAQALRGWDVKKGAYHSGKTIFGAIGDKTDIIGKNYDDRMKSVSQKFDVQWTKVKNEWYKQMAPLLGKLVTLLPDLARYLKFIINNLKELIMVWLGVKLVSAIVRIGLAARGGGAAGLAGQAAGAAASAGGAGAASMGIGGAMWAGAKMFAPVAAGAALGHFVGKTLGGGYNDNTQVQWLANKFAAMSGGGETFSSGGAGASWQAALDKERRRRKFFGNLTWKSLNETEAGVAQQGRLIDLMRGTTTGFDPSDIFSQNEDYARGKKFQYGKLFHRGGIKGARAYAGKMKSEYSSLYETTAQNLRYMNPGKPITREMIEANMPLLKTMRLMITQTEKTLASIALAKQKGQKFTVDVNATVNLSGMNDPGSRVGFASGAVGRAKEIMKQGVKDYEGAGGALPSVPGIPRSDPMKWGG